MRKCIVCEEYKDESEFFKATRSGLRSECKKCHKEYTAKWKAENREKLNQRRREKYQEIKDTPEYKEYVRAKKAYYREHSPNYKKNERARAAAYKASHPEYVKEYAKANPEKFREYARRRQAKKQATQTEPVDYAAVYQRDNGICHICGLAVSLEECHFDHVIPLHHGGTHTADNIRPSHALCNLRKGSKLTYESNQKELIDDNNV